MNAFLFLKSQQQLLEKLQAYFHKYNFIETRAHMHLSYSEITNFKIPDEQLGSNYYVSFLKPFAKIEICFVCIRHEMCQSLTRIYSSAECCSKIRQY